MDPELGPVKMLKVDLSGGFYRLHFIPSDALNLGLAFLKIDSLPDLVSPVQRTNLCQHKVIKGVVSVG